MGPQRAALGRPPGPARPHPGIGHGDRLPDGGQRGLLPALHGPPSGTRAEPPPHQRTSSAEHRSRSRRDRARPGRHPARPTPAPYLGAGGTVEPGETFAEAAVRELHEEAGLVAEPDDVQVLGTLLDRVGDVVRLTVPVLITRWSGIPHQREEAIGSWRFWPLTALPHPLFVPSAQCLTAWNPALPLDHPPARFQPYASPGR
ncbi:NUDIX domain-containing protein [Streptomyces sp. NPDC051644]|uniref:NUDIX domain-containing protein n=1 Tax=Streptomyces sp. NPDC051644 TaxID=3365666 RepID=UPI0037907C0D